MFASSFSFAQQCEHSKHPFTYPTSEKGTQVDLYHGVSVADPYRWLEDANSEATKAWVQTQSKFTQDYLAQIPQREAIKERLTKLWNFERFGVPKYEGKRYFMTRNDGLQNQAVLYTMRDLKETPRLLLDPNTLSADGTVALTEIRVSPNGKYLAYGTAASGSDWNEWQVRDIQTGKDTADHLKWIKFSEVEWRRDSKGFYYSRYDEPKESTKLADVNYFQKLYFHKMGTPQSADVLVYERKDEKEWGFEAKTSADGRYLIIRIGAGTDDRNRIYYQDLKKKNAPIQKLIDQFDASYDFIDNDGPIFWFRTDKDAPRGRIVKMDLRKPGKLIEVVPQAEQAMHGASIIGNRLLLSYLKDARAQVLQYDLHGKLEREVALPGLGTVKGFEGGKKDQQSFYSFANFTTPASIYRYDIKTGESKQVFAPKLDFASDRYETRQVFYRSKDGTKIPMFISAKKGVALDGNNPTVLYGYGGFNVSLTPSFSSVNAAFMEMGGVYAMPNLRGGGEYGNAWHDAGTKLHKQNVFDDFIGAAEYLIAEKYTQPAKLAISGGSNGGLLVGATMTQRPDLFAAALPAVGVLDMLRFHKFTIGWGWIPDYGSSDDAEQFKALFAYSPLHRVKENTCYPATMITTGDHDDRVVPAHSFKFAAALQAAQGGEQPILIRIETKAGHGAGKPTSKQIEEATDKLGFLQKILQIKESAVAAK